MEKLNILILDSNNKDRQELRKIIESTDSDFIYEIMEVANPQKAAQLLSERRIDIMLTEIFVQHRDRDRYHRVCQRKRC